MKENIIITLISITALCSLFVLIQSSNQPNYKQIFTEVIAEQNSADVQKQLSNSTADQIARYVLSNQGVIEAIKKLQEPTTMASSTQ